jgi:hypothetical protein
MFWKKKKKETRANVEDASKKEKPLYLRIAEAVTNDGLPKDFELEPDEIADGIYFQPGARDGMMCFTVALRELDDEEKNKITKIIIKISEGNEVAVEESLCELFKERRMIECMDFVQDEILKNKARINIDNLLGIALYEVFTSANAECVKFGLLVLGMFKTGVDAQIREAIKTLALYEEFTLFCLFNMENWDNAEDEILDVAKKTESWGRVHAIKIIKGEHKWTRKWLITEGAYNSAHLSYTAYDCYVKGQLYDELGGFLSDEEFEGACTIMEGLLEEGPMDGISRVEEVCDFLRRFVSQYANRSIKLYQYELLLYIIDYLERAENENTEAEKVKKLCEEILHSDECVWVVKRAIKDGEGAGLAKELGLDFSEEYYNLLKSDCKKYSHLAAVLMENPENVDWVVSVFENAYGDLKGVSDPNAWAFDDDVITVVMCIQELKPHIGKGVSLLAKASSSTARQLRNMVLNVAEAWMETSGKSIAEIAPELYETFEEMLCNETVEDYKFRIQGILSNQIYIPEPLRIG